MIKRLIMVLAMGAALFAAPSFAHAQAGGVRLCYDGSPPSTPLGVLPCVPAIQALKSVPIDVTSNTTTQLVALTANEAIYVTSYDFMAGGTSNATLVYGTGSACGTGQVALTGPYPLIAQAGISKGNGLGPILYVPQGNALCIINSGDVQLSGSVSFVQF